MKIYQWTLIVCDLCDVNKFKQNLNNLTASIKLNFSIKFRIHDEINGSFDAAHRIFNSQKNIKFTLLEIYGLVINKYANVYMTLGCIHSLVV